MVFSPWKTCGSILLMLLLLSVLINLNKQLYSIQTVVIRKVIKKEAEPKVSQVNTYKTELQLKNNVCLNGYFPKGILIM